MANHLSNPARDVAADAVTTLCDGGYLRIYDGVPPPTPDDPITDQVQLAELLLSATAFGPSFNGVATAAPIASDPSADATGQATWFRVFEADGTSAVYDGTVGTGSADLNFNSTAFVAGAEVAVTAFTYTQAR